MKSLQPFALPDIRGTSSIDNRLTPPLIAYDTRSWFDINHSGRRWPGRRCSRNTRVAWSRMMTVVRAVSRDWAGDWACGDDDLGVVTTSRTWGGVKETHLCEGGVSRDVNWVVRSMGRGGGGFGNANMDRNHGRLWRLAFDCLAALIELGVDYEKKDGIKKMALYQQHHCWASFAEWVKSASNFGLLTRWIDWPKDKETLRSGRVGDSIYALA